MAIELDREKANQLKEKYLKDDNWVQEIFDYFHKHNWHLPHEITAMREVLYEKTGVRVIQPGSGTVVVDTYDRFYGLEKNVYGGRPAQEYDWSNYDKKNQSLQIFIEFKNNLEENQLEIQNELREMTGDSKLFISFTDSSVQLLSARTGKNGIIVFDSSEGEEATILFFLTKKGLNVEGGRESGIYKISREILKEFLEELAENVSKM